MNLIGQGIDLIECSRIEHILREHHDRFLARILTEAERAYCQRHREPVQRVAGRFAAKEAVLKALGTGWRGQIAWTDVEILNDPAGQPHVHLTGHTAELAKQLGIERIFISITHTEHYAAAIATGVKT